MLLLIFCSITITWPGNPIVIASGQNNVTIADYSFQPEHLNVTTGITVIWTYLSNGISMHTVTSVDNKTQSGTPLLSSGSISPGHSYNFTFYNPGIYTYQCGFHPIMTGWVNVTGPAIIPPTVQGQGNNFTNTAIIVGVAVALVIVTVAVLFSRRRKTGKSDTVTP